MKPATNTNASSTAALRVSSIMVSALLDAARQFGVSPEKLLDTSSEDAPARLDRDICMSEFQLLFERAVMLTGRPGLGLLLGMNAREHSFDVLGHLISHAHTMRHGLALCSQYHAIAMEGGVLLLSERAGRARVECAFPHHDALLDRGLAELVVAGFLRMLLVYGGAPSDVYMACFTHDKPAHHEAYSAIFNGVERFRQPFIGIEFDARLLDLPHLHARPELNACLQTQAERKLCEISRPQTVVERLQQILRSTSKPGAFTMPHAARTLKMSVRSLRRRLDEQGASFRDLIDEARRDAAYRMLRDPDRTIQSASFELGFASPSVFHRAFKRWAGITPQQYRERALSVYVDRAH